jgi:hypothetical protein
MAEDFKCLNCSKVYDSFIKAVLCEALDEWEYASQYKGKYLQIKHGDLERIEEIRRSIGST